MTIKVSTSQRGRTNLECCIDHPHAGQDLEWVLTVANKSSTVNSTINVDLSVRSVTLKLGDFGNSSSSRCQKASLVMICPPEDCSLEPLPVDSVYVRCNHVLSNGLWDSKTFDLCMRRKNGCKFE